MDDDGIIWASRYECEVYHGLRRALGEERVLRTSGAEEGDSFTYTTPVKQGHCMVCGSGEVVQQRVYTPDVRILSTRSSDPARNYHIEAKGYINAEKRNLLRNFVKTGPDINLVLIVQRDIKVTPKRKLTEWAKSYLKCPVFVWDAGKKPVPEELLGFFDF